VLPQEAEEVEAGNVGDAAHVPGIAQLVEDPSVDPPEVEVIPRGPDDRGHSGVPEVELGQLCGLVADGDAVVGRCLDRGPVDTTFDPVV
jgi:hypothetical protein